MKLYQIKAKGRTYTGLFSSSIAAVLWAIDALGAMGATARPL